MDLDKRIKVIIGLGNPGVRFDYTRHNIGFMVLDALADKYNASWGKKDNLEYAQIHNDNDEPVLLIKPLTYMNESGKVVQTLTKKGVEAENILVVHDELEYPFGKVGIKEGGSARGHNGLRSLIEYVGRPDFFRVRCGIGRPEEKEQVADYVLQKFSEAPEDVEAMIEETLGLINGFLAQDK